MMVHDFKKSKRIIGGNKLPVNVHVVPLDNISFHLEKSVLNWMYEFHSHIVPKTREGIHYKPLKRFQF